VTLLERLAPEPPWASEVALCVPVPEVELVVVPPLCVPEVEPVVVPLCVPEVEVPVCAPDCAPTDAANAKADAIQSPATLPVISAASMKSFSRVSV
jgi:hypothetical protein